MSRRLVLILVLCVALAATLVYTFTHKTKAPPGAAARNASAPKSKGPTGNATKPKMKVDIDFLTGLFSMGKEEVLNSLGAGYEVVPTGGEGAYDGYYYRDLGICVAFKFDFQGNGIEWIDCDAKVDIHGANAGMGFARIQEKLGPAEIKTFTYRPEDVMDVTEWWLEYRINGCLVKFVSKDEAGREIEVEILRDEGGSPG